VRGHKISSTYQANPDPENTRKDPENSPGKTLKKKSFDKLVGRSIIPPHNDRAGASLFCVVTLERAPTPPRTRLRAAPARGEPTWEVTVGERGRVHNIFVRLPKVAVNRGSDKAPRRVQQDLTRVLPTPRQIGGRDGEDAGGPRGGGPSHCITGGVKSIIGFGIRICLRYFFVVVESVIPSTTQATHIPTRHSRPPLTQPLLTHATSGDLSNASPIGSHPLHTLPTLFVFFYSLFPNKDLARLSSTARTFLTPLSKITKLAQRTKLEQEAYDEKNKLLNQSQFQELLELQTDEVGGGT
jgi:hypothetical protein